MAITDFHGHIAATDDDPGAAALSCEFNIASSGYDTTLRLSASLVSPEGIVGLMIADPVVAINDTGARLEANGQADLVVGLIHKDMEATATSFDEHLQRGDD